MLNFDFTQRTLVLTGANGGIGRDLALLFAKAGANLVLADIDEPALIGFVGSDKTFDPTKISIRRVDSANPKDADALIADAVRQFDGVDFLVPSAGI